QLGVADGGDRGQRHDALVAHRQTGSGPDGAEKMVDGEVEVRIALDVRHLPAVDLVHLLEALAAQLVHPTHSFVCGTPSPAARFFSAISANGSSTPVFLPSASASFRS